MSSCPLLKRRTRELLLTLLTLVALGAAPPALATELTHQEMKADLEVFRTKFLAVDKSYSAAARTEAERRLEELESALTTLSRAQFELTLAQIAALADNGHTVAFPGPRSRNFNRVEVRVTPFVEQFRLLRATPAHAALLGARLVSIDGRPTAEVVQAARALSGGVNGWRDRSANYVIESPEQLYALGLVDQPETAHYVWELPGGREVERQLAAEPANPDRMRAGAGRWLWPELAPEERGTWQALLNPEEVAWAFRDPEASFRSRDLPELDTFLIELRRNNDAPGMSMRSALQQFRRAIEAADRPHLIVDMRQNGGGDLNTTRDFLQTLPALVPGRIFVLIGPWTFSAGVSSTGYLKQAAPDRVTLVGEQPGERLEFFSEGGIATLPNSGTMLLNATERHDYRTGCRNKPDCHGPVARHPISVPSLAPEIPAPWTFEAYVAGRDPGIEAVAAALGDTASTSSQVD